MERTLAALRPLRMAHCLSRSTLHTPMMRPRHSVVECRSVLSAYQQKKLFSYTSRMGSKKGGSEDSLGQSVKKSTCCHGSSTSQTVSSTASSASMPTSPRTMEFWSSRQTWNRASVNTFRCLVGCTLGDFGAMWFLQAYYAGLGMGPIMAISMASGLSTSMLLETVLLRIGRDKLPWVAAAKTAAGMSLISMITMEAAENAVDYYLTGGVVAVDSPAFWAAALVSVAAGFMAPLPYNYMRLRKYGRACH